MKLFRFSKVKIAELPTPEHGQVEYGDTEVNGLRVRVGSSGVKSFCISRKRNGKFIRATLGRFPDLSVDNARAKAMELLGEVATTGINPNIAKRTNNKAMITLSEAIDAYVKNRSTA